MRGAARLASLLRRAADRLQPGERHAPLVLGQTQRAFVDWNAERLGISAAESLERYRRSWALFAGGHAGNTYRAWDERLECVRVFADDSPSDVFGAYRMLAPFTFLRLLSYREPVCGADDPAFRTLRDHSEVSILDFGCGLAQNSRALALALQHHGARVQIAFADIATITFEFLRYLAKRQGLTADFLECSETEPIPGLPASDVIFAQEFLEHVHDPLVYLAAFNHALKPGGLLITNVADHQPEFMHVHPDLGDARAWLSKTQYDELHHNTVFRKRG